ncbi:MAG: selenide, water dikinase SelD [Oscillospiraceae bacterium]
MFDPRLLVGYDSSDDACVYSVSDDVAVIETVDFFTPIVDDPYLFGQIAAAERALRRVRHGRRAEAGDESALRAEPPSARYRPRHFEGGHDKAVEAGCVIAGGHTIQDDEPKYGLCVTGFVHPQHILKNIGAQPGDVLVLTKALGVGVITTALKAASCGRQRPRCGVCEHGGA